MKNLEGLNEYSKQRNKETFDKVNKAISSLKRSKKKITIAEVARKAKVSVATIYNNPELKERITQLKDLGYTNGSNDGKKALKSSRMKNTTKIDELKNKNKELREEIENLKLEKGLLIGKLRDLANENLDLKEALHNYRNIKNLK